MAASSAKARTAGMGCCCQGGVVVTTRLIKTQPVVAHALIPLLLSHSDIWPKGNVALQVDDQGQVVDFLQDPDGSKVRCSWCELS